MSVRNKKIAKFARGMLVTFFFAAGVCLMSMFWHGVTGNLIGATASVLVTVVCIGGALLFSAVEDEVIKDEGEQT